MATRIRRGKEVEIPLRWKGRVPTAKTMRHRKQEQKMTRLNRRQRVKQEAADFEKVLAE